jgi:hypothetical protein
MTEIELVDLFLKYLFDSGIEDGIGADLAEELGLAITGLTREQALQVSREQAAELVKNIAESMRQNLRDILAKGLADQVGVDELARRMREGLPLTEQQLGTLEKFKQDLEATGVLPGTDAYDAAVAQRARELQADRARTIARTEAAKAIEAGEQDVAVSRGANMKVWLTVADDRVSEFCAACEAQGPIPIDEDFVGDGSFSAVQTAPGHPNCRCTVTYFTDSGKGETGRQRKLQDQRIAATKAARDAAAAGD